MSPKDSDSLRDASSPMDGCDDVTIKETCLPKTEQQNKAVKCVSKTPKGTPSKHLVTIVLFVAMMLDVMLMTSIDPIIPDILHKIHANHIFFTYLNFTDGHLINGTTNETAYHSSFGYIKQTNCSNVTDRHGILNVEFLNRSVEIPRTKQRHKQTRIFNRDPIVHFKCVNDSEDTRNEFGFMAVQTEIGIMVAGKPAVEMFTNIAVGFLVNRCGPRVPMLLGFLFTFLSTVGFAYARRFSVLLITRMAQAIGSSLSVVAGLSFLAAVYKDDAERSKATSRAFGGISLGIILGYPYGSAVYEFLGKEAPFLILAGVAVLDGALLAMVLGCFSLGACEGKGTEKKNKTGFLKLCIDPYVVVGLGCSFMVHFGLGVFLATGPAWMLGELHAQQWNIGVVLAVAVIFHFTAQFLTGLFAIKLGRWIFCMVGMWIFSLGMAVYPLCQNIWEVLGPEITVRIGHGTVLCVISPLLGHVADIRFDSNYGAVYGLYTASYNLGLSVGPVVGGAVVQYMTIDWLYRTTAIGIFLFAFLSTTFRHIEPKNFNKLTAVQNSNTATQKTYGSTDAREQPDGVNA
ncbi:unnamed protein product [Owenia fusiformis]|uniref:Uncharacterized protein n=1 Tax=Owenia fusiformis TaxID=6347 RepID=A0A8J1TFC8_OWEFU|nr:unnamed protein product [Owenia fusiformis]